MTTEKNMANNLQAEKKGILSKIFWHAMPWIFVLVFLALLVWVIYMGPQISTTDFEGEGSLVKATISTPLKDNIIHSLGCQGAIFFLIVVGVLFVVYLLYSWLSVSNKEKLWKVVDHNIKWCFLIVWIFGFITYCVGTHVGPHENMSFFQNILSVAPMAIIHATEMFVGLSDISAIHDEQHQNAFYMMCFNLSHFLAICCSMIFVLMQFGYFMKTKIVMWWRSKFRVKGNLYIFWGLNEKSLLLAQSISNKIQEDKKNGVSGGDSERKSKIIFVRTYDDSESHSSNISFERLFSMVKMKNNEIDQLRRMNCYVSTSFHQLSKAELKVEKDKTLTADILRNHLHLFSLAKMIKKTKGKAHFFILNEDEEVNINCTRRIVNDKTINEANCPVIVHCYARKTHESRMEEEGLDVSNAQTNNENKVEVNIIDTSALSVNLLKSDVTHHPISFVDVNTTTNPGTVTSRFHALIVGFGETGRDAFRFLYEYGAFLDESSTDMKTKRSQFVCDIVDMNFDNIYAYFKKTRPMFDENDQIKLFKGSRNYKITGYNTNYKTDKFYKTVLSWNNLRSLNYVVISLGNDDEGLTVALRILLEAQRVKESLDKFHIFLRVFDATRAKEIKHVIDHYNGIYRKQKNDSDLIIPFGDPEELFTYDIIVHNKFQQESMVYYYYYERMCDLMKNSDPDPLKTLMDEINKNGLNHEAARTMWENRHTSVLRRDDQQNLIEKIRNLRRSESQDLANAYHRHTKMYIINEVTKNGNLDEVAMAKLYENLAVTEHLRWNAAHEMLGYVHDSSIDKCDDLGKRHNCLVEWEKLDAVSNRKEKNTGNFTDYKHYDRVVVSTSILLQHLDDLSKQNKVKNNNVAIPENA